MKKLMIAMLSAAMALMLCFAGCSSNSKDMADGYNYAVTEDAAYTEPAEAPAPGAATAYEYGLDTSAYADMDKAKLNTGDMYGGRKIIRNYDISLATNTFDDDLAYINAKLSELGGYVLSSSLSGSKPEAYGDSGRSLSMTLRVPAEKASDFVSGVQQLGKVDYIHDYTDDVTDQYFDVDTRLAVLKDQLERLRTIMVETDNLADIITLEERISEVMLQIEELTGTLKRYDALIAYTTIDLSINERNAISGPADTKGTGERISEGFTDTLNGVATFFVNFFVWFVSSLPVLIILAAITVAVVFIVKHAVKKNRAKKAQLYAAQQQQQQAYYQQQQQAYYQQQQQMQQNNAQQDNNK
ncbi:MAG: DUF4349 domain-containing protein [Clostridiales bacterium]|nr:DUF4349 domain-containing protein [Clostridiales bacterium]